MKKMSKPFSRVLGLVLVFAMMFSVGSVYAGDGHVENTPLEQLRAELLQEYPALVEAEAINKTIDLFIGENVFEQHYAADPVGALENVRNSAISAIRDSSSPLWLSNGLYGASAPVIRQYKYYTCGPTSALQILTGMGVSGRIAGSTDNQKQDTLEVDMGTSGSTMVYQVVNGINKYSDTTYFYTQTSSLEDFKSQIKASLFRDKPLILHSFTLPLTYYAGHDSYHYIVLKGYNMNTGKVVLADCNYNYQYCGEFTVTIEEAYNALFDEAGNKRYIIRA